MVQGAITLVFVVLKKFIGVVYRLGGSLTVITPSDISPSILDLLFLSLDSNLTLLLLRDMLVNRFISFLRINC